MIPQEYLFMTHYIVTVCFIIVSQGHGIEYGADQRKKNECPQIIECDEE